METRYTLFSYLIISVQMKAKEDEFYIAFNFYNREWVTICILNSPRPSDAYMRRKTNHHWFR